MRFGKTYWDRMRQSQDKYKNVPEKVRFAFLPKQMPDGKWLWLEDFARQPFTYVDDITYMTKLLWSEPVYPTRSF